MDYKEKYNEWLNSKVISESVKEELRGIAGGDGCGVLIKHGEIIKKFEEDKLLAVLKDELEIGKGAILVRVWSLFLP